MTINKKQFVYLQEMGIPLWQRKSNKQPALSEEAIQQPDTTDEDLVINIEDVINQRLFLDTILALNLQPADFTQVSPNKLQCDDFIWQFNNNEHLEYTHNVLSTPVLSAFIDNPKLKKRLYQQLVNNESVNIHH
ncbi:DNA polymerase III subunit psi [Thalassotalea sediminis]|uniref:DNA polymerase III subunit psi n=1 Tax=Thalassotalea sediminis TaxID=1759089 RepID=UPI0025726526|nr:DNA polymerase III subunit psi [Thalassotalea sediminis]